MNKIIIVIIAISVLLSVLVFGIDTDKEKCSWSKYNKYTNQTGGFKFFNNCYVPGSIIYTSTKKCGLFGISCYETEPYTKMRSSQICFKYKTGELC